jgi:N4-gp56 family major capsid protein
MIAGDPEFVAWSQFGFPEKGKKNYIGEFAGVKVLPSTAMLVTTGGTLSVGSFSTVGLSCAISLICGKGAFGVTELAGLGGVKVIAKKPSSNDTSNPLDLYSTVGLKITMAATVLNPKCAFFMVNTVGLA